MASVLYAQRTIVPCLWNGDSRTFLSFEMEAIDHASSGIIDLSYNDFHGTIPFLLCSKM